MEYNLNTFNHKVNVIITFQSNTNTSTLYSTTIKGRCALFLLQCNE